MHATTDGRQRTGQARVSMTERVLGPRTTYARLLGALFLVGFLTYGIGFSLVNSVISVPGFMATLPAVQSSLVIGAVLMLMNTVVDIGKGVLFFPILENHGKRTAFVYLAAIVAQVVLLDIGVLFLLMLVPLAQIAADAGAASAAWAPGLGALLTKANTIAYNVGQATLAFGAIFLCVLLFRTRMIPQVLAGLGVVGYMLHAAGSVSELLGFPLSLYLLIPGALFEIGIAFWLIVKGFQPAAIAKGLRAPVGEDRTVTEPVPVAG